MADLRQQLIQSCAAECGPRVVPIHHTLVRAFQISDGRTYGVNDTWHSIEDALAGLPIVRLLNHKDSVVLREEWAHGVRIHVYRVKQRSRARYVHKDHIRRAVKPMYLEEVCQFDGGVVGVRV